jgi:hypothetical protein
MRTPRFRAQAFPRDHVHAGYYGIRETATGIWVDQYGRPDPEYYAATPDVAKMRARDLRMYAEQWAYANRGSA